MMNRSNLQETGVVPEKKQSLYNNRRGVRFLQAYGTNVSKQPEPLYSLDIF